VTDVIGADDASLPKARVRFALAMTEIDRIEERFIAGDADAARRELFERLEDTEGAAQLYAEIVTLLPRVRHLDAAATLAMAGGTLVEYGAPAGPLGRAIIDPLVRSLIAGRRLLEALRGRYVEDGDVQIGDGEVTEKTMDELTAADSESVLAWRLLEEWFAPAVVCWTRDVAVLREAQRDEQLCALVRAIGDATPTTMWLSRLLAAVLDAPFVVLFPEIGEAWRVMVDGVLDIAQLSVLLAHELAAPIRTIRGSKPPSAEQLATLREGDQLGEPYGCTVHFYPPQALDPATGMPRDGRYTWTAPGGTGSHSLPEDFQPGTLAPREGARILVAVGPRAPGMLRGTREVRVGRTFETLAARVLEARKLDEETTRQWFALARR
jgi:hypothetical protein